MLLERWAATYFSTNKCSIISEGGLNFGNKKGEAAAHPRGGLAHFYKQLNSAEVHYRECQMA